MTSNGLKSFLRHSTALALAVPVSLAAATGVWGQDAANQAQTSQDQTSQAQTSQSQAATDTTAAMAGLEQNRTLLTPARLVIGRDLVNEEYERVGTIKFLMVDVAEGDIVYALASTDEAMGQFKAVPWDAIDGDDFVGWQSTGLLLNVPGEEFAEAPEYGMEQILRLTTPAIMTEVSDYYRVDMVPTGEGPLLMMGRDVFGTLSRPVAQVANQLEGTTVVASDGQEIGAVEEVMVDVDEGVVPYVLVSRGAFLGIGGQWLAIPPQALQWQADSGNYRVDLGDTELSELPLAGDPTLSAFVSLDDLETLYDFFEVDPYWQNG